MFFFFPFFSAIALEGARGDGNATAYQITYFYILQKKHRHMQLHRMFFSPQNGIAFCVALVETRTQSRALVVPFLKR